MCDTEFVTSTTIKMISSKALLVLLSAFLLIAASTASPVDLNKPDGPPPPHARGFISRMMDSVKPETIGDAAKNLCPDLLPETSSAAPVTTEPTETTASPVSPPAAPADTSAGLVPDAYIGEPFLYGYAGDEPVYYYPGDLDDAMLEDATYYYNTRSAREAKTDDCPFLTHIPATIVMNKDACIEHDMAVHYMMSRQHINMHRGHFASSGSGDCGPSGDSKVSFLRLQ